MKNVKYSSGTGINSCVIRINIYMRIDGINEVIDVDQKQHKSNDISLQISALLLMDFEACPFSTTFIMHFT